MDIQYATGLIIPDDFSGDLSGSGSGEDIQYATGLIIPDDFSGSSEESGSGSGP